MPTGTVTFLFTDIEGSTQRWDAHGDAMRAAVKRHDTIMRTAIESHRGFVFKTVGDAFCAAFSRAGDALAAAGEAQHLLNEGDFADVDGLRVRMGVHTGEADEREGDYFGPTLNRVARLASIGHGGQVLLSEASRCAIGSETPANTTLVDLGFRRLKDLTQPEHVWQLSIATLPSEFPALNSLDARPNNLPIQLTVLIGREPELQELRTLVGAHRLVTVSGSGGVGKTRVALQVGADLIDRYADGVWFVDLAPIKDSELVSSAVAQALNITAAGGQSLDDAIPYALKRKQLLMILDNCEHVVEAAAALAHSILASVSDVRILATSRQALGIVGEAVHRLPSLAVPKESTTLTVDEAQSYGAIALFVERARAADSRFVLTDETARTVGEICRRLDGIPLALELAAARVKVLAIPTLAKRLDERFRILTGGSRTALPRQQTLAALIDWSYNLLSVKEQKLLCRVAIFPGNFSLDAASAVCADDLLGADEIFDLISSLVEKSLLMVDWTSDGARYRLFESTREYALEKLKAAGEREDIARRHAGHFRALAERFDDPSAMREGPPDPELQLEVDNFRAALKWSLEQSGDAVVGGALAGALQRLWRGGFQLEGRRWIETALAKTPEDAQGVEARLWLALTSFTSGDRLVEASEHALLRYERLGDRKCALRALHRVAFGHFQAGRYDAAEEFNARALAGYEESGNEQGVAAAILLRGILQWTRGDVEGARATYLGALARFRNLGWESLMAGLQGNLAEVELARGDSARALSLVDEAIAYSRRHDDKERLAVGLCNLAIFRIVAGDVAGGWQAAHEAVNAGRDIQASLLTAIALQHLALVRALRGEADRASRLLGYVDEVYRSESCERESMEALGYEKLMTALRERLTEEDLEVFRSQGATWSEDDAVAEALKL